MTGSQLDTAGWRTARCLYNDESKWTHQHEHERARSGPVRLDINAHLSLQSLLQNLSLQPSSFW